MDCLCYYDDYEQYELKTMDAARRCLADDPNIYERLRERSFSPDGRLLYSKLDGFLTKELDMKLRLSERNDGDDCDARRSVMGNLSFLEETVEAMKADSDTKAEAFPRVAKMLVDHDWKGLVGMMDDRMRFQVLKRTVPRIVDEIEETRTSASKRKAKGGAECT